MSANTPTAARRARAGRATLAALAADAALVVAFAALGRATHEGPVLGEWGARLATTAWPFLVSLALGWLLSLAWRAPLAPLRAGVPIWLVTVAGGMLLRALSGQGIAVPFVVVATLALLLLLVGWRAIATMLAARRRQPR